MIPIKIISKLVRSRSHVVLKRNPIMTSSKLWSSKSGSKNDGGSKCGEDGVKKQYNQSSDGEEQEHFKKIKQEEGNSSRASRDIDKNIKESQQHKSTGLNVSVYTKGKEQSRGAKSRGSSCPPYATPKNEELKTSYCPETKENVKTAVKCEAERKKVDPGDQRKQKEGLTCEKQRRDDRCDTHFNKNKTTSSLQTCDNSRENTSCVTKSSQKNKGSTYRCGTPKKSNFCDKGSREKIDSADCCGTLKVNDPCDTLSPRKLYPSVKCEKLKSVPCITKSSNRYTDSENSCETGKIDDPCNKDINRKQLFTSDCCETKNNNEPCDTSHHFINYSEKEECTSGNRVTYCEPKKSPCVEGCKEPKDDCSSNDTRKQKSEDPCKVNMFTFNTNCDQEPDCKDSCIARKKEEQCLNVREEKIDCCEPRNQLLEMYPQKRDEYDKKDPCKTSNEQTNDCTKIKKHVCCEEERSDCTKHPCREIKIPELSPSCKVDAAKECLRKLKELQKQWEEVIAAQEQSIKNHCTRPKVDSPQESRCKPAEKIHRRSNMIYIVLSAVLGAVMYYIYNGDFESEELFLEEEQEKEDKNDEEN